MSRIAVLALVAIASVLLLGSPARGQSAEEIEKLIAQLGDEDASVRRNAAWGLSYIGPKAAPAVITALIAVLVDEDRDVRTAAAGALGRSGPRATLAVPALIVALTDEESMVRHGAAEALGNIGPGAVPAVPALIVALSDDSLSGGPWTSEESVSDAAARAIGQIGPRAAPAVPSLIAKLVSDRNARSIEAHALTGIGTDLSALWWVVPLAYWKELVSLLLLIFVWFGLFARFPRHRSDSTPKHLALMALSATVPVTLSCSAVGYAITREWAQGFLPKAITVVPFPVAAVLSVAFACVLPAVWVCQRKGSDRVDGLQVGPDT